MQFLFLSYIFPGPLGAMASWLAARPENQVIFASTRSRQELPLPNVKRVVVKTYAGKKSFETPDYFELWEEAAKAGKSARSSLTLVKGSGFEPDMIFMATSNGSGLALRQLFPDAFLVNFLEEDNFDRPAQIALRRAVQSLQILQANLAFAFSEKRRNFYAPELRPKIAIAPEVINSAFFSRQEAAPFHCWKFEETGPDLVTVFAQGCDERELFHCWHACLELLEAREHCQIMMLVNGAYTARRLANIAIDGKYARRICIEAHLRQDALRDLLCSSSVAVFPGQHIPFGLLEAMSCACCPMLCTHRYYLKNGWDCLELDISSSRNMAENIRVALAHPVALGEIGANARQTASENFGADNVMPRFYPQIEKEFARWND